ncbi:ABC transporter permease [Anoxybacteroides tepidamans]|uniref:ABC transporter permease n=1 Tax=Anoxybacteroides tepidamans TaxID=265948 RepID=UPI000A527CAD|nr:ABC transporter permease [Anoxybacillus tepidamans]
MRSKTFLFSRSIWLQQIRNIGWIALAHLLLLLAVVPLPMIVVYTTKATNQLPTWRNIYSISGPFQGMIAFTIPVLLAIFLFRYMQVKNSADYMHSLPFRREALFAQNMVLGLAILFIPIIVTACLTAMLCYVLPIDRSILAMADVMRWTAEMGLMELFVFTASVFVGMLTGLSVLQGAFAYILFLFPTGISVLVLLNMEYMLRGFASEYYLTAKLEQIVPFVRFLELESRSLSTTEAGCYIIVTMLFTALSLWLYRKRQSEAANQALAFPILRPVFLYGVAFCFMLVGGLYFGEMTVNSLGWIIFGYVMFSFIGFFVAKMIVEKTWRVFYKWKEYMYFVAAMLVVGVIIHFDLTGYEKRIPQLSEIEQVYFGNSTARFQQFFQEEHNVSIEQPDQFLKSKENIKNVYLFHQQLIENRNTHGALQGDFRNVAIGYVLKNGDRFIRTYSVPADEYMLFARPIVESNEYKKNYYFLLHDKGVAPIRQVTIIEEPVGEKRVTLIEPKQINEFMSSLKQDMMEEKMESLVGGVGTWGMIELLQSDGDIIHVTWKKTYAHTEQWLTQHKLLSKARLTAAEVDYALVVKNKERKPLYEILGDPNSAQAQQFLQQSATLRVTNKQQIEELLRQSASNPGDALYFIAFYRSGQREPQWEVIDEKNIPSFIREQLP